MNPTAPPRVHVRWSLLRDFPAVVEIEAACFDDPWTEDEFKTTLRSRNVIMVVAERDGRVVGYAVYEIGKSALKILTLGVAPDARRAGVGIALAARVVNKAAGSGRAARVVVSEKNLAAQLFFRACEFRAVRVKRDAFTDGAAGYVMECHI